MGFGFCHELTNLNPIAAALRQICLSNSSSGKLAPRLLEKRPRILKIRKSANLNPQNPYSFWSGCIAYDSKLDMICPVARHTKGLSSRQ